MKSFVCGMEKIHYYKRIPLEKSTVTDDLSINITTVLLCAQVSWGKKKKSTAIQNFNHLFQEDIALQHLIPKYFETILLEDGGQGVS